MAPLALPAFPGEEFLPPFIKDIFTDPMASNPVAPQTDYQLPANPQTSKQSEAKNVGDNNPTGFVVLAVCLFLLFVIIVPLVLCW